MSNGFGWESCQQQMTYLNALRECSCGHVLLDYGSIHGLRAEKNCQIIWWSSLYGLPVLVT